MNHLEKDLKTFKEIEELYRALRDSDTFVYGAGRIEAPLSMAKDIVLNRQLTEVISKTKSEYIG